MTKEVKVKVVSQNGHETLLLSPKQALETIRTETKEKGKWTYVDGNYRSYDSLTEADIEKASDITIVSALLGGE